MAIPNGGAFKQEQGRYGQIYPRTPANYGFSVMAKVKPGREGAVREYGSTIEKLVAGDPKVLAPLKLHYLRWVLFEIKGDTYFMYQGIFDTDFDKYIEDAVALFASTGIMTVFTNLEGSPRTGEAMCRRSTNTSGSTNARAFLNTLNILTRWKMRSKKH